MLKKLEESFEQTKKKALISTNTADDGLALESSHTRTDSSNQPLVQNDAKTHKYTTRWLNRCWDQWTFFKTDE